MPTDFTHRLTAQSIVGELPSHGMTLPLSARGKVLGEAFDQRADLPGVVMTTDGGSVRGVISRGQYLRLVGRHLGHEVYDPRPLQLMFDALDPGEEPLMMAATTPIQGAVAQALDRPRHLIYEPVIVQLGDASLRLVDFPDLLRADARISALRNVQMRQILATVQEGFLLVDRDQRIAAEYSSSIERLLGVEALAGRRFAGVLSEILTAEQAELGRDYLATLFDPNVIERLVQSINPLVRVEAQVGGRTRHLAFRFVRSNEDGAIRRLLVRLEDVTREVELAAEIEAQEQRNQERVDLAFDIVRADPDALGDFLGRFRREIAAGAQSLGRNGDGPPPAERLRGLSRSLHTLKGEAGMLGLAIYQRRLHRAEDRVLALGDGVEVADLAQLRPELSDLDLLAREALELIDRFRRLGGAAGTTQSAARPPSQLPSQPPASPASAVQAPELNAPAPTAPPPTTPAPTTGAESPGLFAGVARLVEELSQRLGKSARFVSHSAEAEIPSRYRDLARDALIQLARNALVHGLESPEERQRNGKPALGTLQFAVRRQPGRLELVFQDDGAGLDLEAIAQRAAERGLVVPASPGSERQLARLIFEPGFSTARDTTVDAGRGVGLDLVLARVVELGGSIVPHSRRGELCAFQILLPEPPNPS